MISLKRSLDEYDVLNTVLSTSVGAIVGMLEAIRQYSIETDPAAIQQLRSDLACITERVRTVMTAPQDVVISAVPADVRGALRDYRDQALVYLDRLRSDLEGTADALHQLLSTMQGDGSDSEHALEKEIASLRDAASLPHLDSIREAIRRSAGILSGCVERLRQEKNSVIVQLQGEIQTLQQSLDRVQRAATVDASTGVYKKEEFVRLLRREVVSQAEVGVLHIRLRNLQQLKASNSEPVLRCLVTAFAKRLKSKVTVQAVAGRWDEDVFVFCFRRDCSGQPRRR